jgi:hypothetical protein
MRSRRSGYVVVIEGILRPPSLVGAWLALVTGVASPAAGAQVGIAGTDTAAVVADAGDVLGSARAAQAAFERMRERHLPFTFASAGGTCDEVVGRLCTWYGEGEWRPTPDPEEVRELRAGLLTELDSLQRLSPREGWIVGQRVWYRAEGDDWEGALVAARACAADAWWCAALEGFALHGLERFAEAEVAFRRAIEGLEAIAPERARTWRVAERVVDSDARRALRDLERAGPEALAHGLERLWRFADPLYLVAGNDRLTVHYARWTVATLKDGARNPFRLRWGRDLEELTVRHGWEIGWERSPSAALGGPFTITGHKHPEAREYMPSGEALTDPASVSADRFVADRARPRSLYAPPYAPVIMPMEGQLRLFPRVDGVVLVATAFLPEDTSFHAGHDHERPWMEPGGQAGLSDRVGLFAVPVAGGRAHEEIRTGPVAGTLALELAPGGYVVSVESWSPDRRMAGRLRRGITLNAVPPDVAALSDILLLEGDRAAPASLHEALPAALQRTEVRSGEALAIAWEVAGLGFRPEILELEVSVDRTDTSILRRLGALIGLADRPASLALSWEEPGPDHPAPLFRHLDLDLPRSIRATTRSPSPSAPSAAPTPSPAKPSRSSRVKRPAGSPTTTAPCGPRTERVEGACHGGRVPQPSRGGPTQATGRGWWPSRRRGSRAKRVERASGSDASAPDEGGPPAPTASLR